MKVLEGVLKSKGLLVEENLKLDELNLGEEPENPNLENQEKELTYELLSKEEQKAVNTITEQIEITNANEVLIYAADIQERITNFTKIALAGAKTEQIEEAGILLREVAMQMSGENKEEGKRKEKRFWHRGMKSDIKNDINNDINKKRQKLELYKIQIQKEQISMEKLFEESMRFAKELSLYTIAGERSIKRLKEEQSLLAEKMEKRLQGLKVTRLAVLQMIPQVKMLSRNNRELIKNIQYTLEQIWKSTAQ